jgi:hypothetical protein
MTARACPPGLPEAEVPIQRRCVQGVAHRGSGNSGLARTRRALSSGTTPTSAGGCAWPRNGTPSRKSPSETHWRNGERPSGTPRPRIRTALLARWPERGRTPLVTSTTRPRTRRGSEPAITARGTRTRSMAIPDLSWAGAQVYESTTRVCIRDTKTPRHHERRDVSAGLGCPLEACPKIGYFRRTANAPVRQYREPRTAATLQQLVQAWRDPIGPRDPEAGFHRRGNDVARRPRSPSKHENVGPAGLLGQRCHFRVTRQHDGRRHGRIA